jgi:hypothetical protein
MAEEPDRHLRTGVRNVDALERLGVARAFERVHIGPEGSVVEPMDLLRGHQRPLRLGVGRIDIGEEIREQRDDIEPDEHDRSADRELVLAKPPPDELPLRRDGDAVLGDDAELQALWMRQPPTSLAPQPDARIDPHQQQSERNVPMTVITPSSRMIVPARNMSWAISALSSTGRRSAGSARATR